LIIIEEPPKPDQITSNMIIPKDSILNFLPTKNIDEKELFWFGAIISIIKMLEISYSRLFNLISTSRPNFASEYLIIEAWSIVDNYNRLYWILSHCPRIKKKSPWIKLMLNELKEVENLRHFIQHYNREIENLYVQSLPLLGYLCYAIIIDSKRIRTITVIPGYVRKCTLPSINPAGKEFKMNIDLITYYIGNYTINLSKLLYKTQDFVKEFGNFISTEFPTKPLIS